MRDLEELMREAMHEQTPHLTMPHDAASRALRTGRRRQRIDRAGTGLLIVAVVAGLVGLTWVPRHERSVEVGAAHVTLTSSDLASSKQLTAAAEIVRARLAAQGISARTSVAAGVITVSVPTPDVAAVAAAALPGVLTFREIYTDPSGNLFQATNPILSAGRSTTAVRVIGLDAAANEVDQTVPSAATLEQFATLDCSNPTGRPSTVDEDPHHFVVACDRGGQSKYLLTPADLLGTQLSSATATQAVSSSGITTPQWVVDLTFSPSAVSQIEAVSTRLFHHDEQQLAITIDGEVVSAPATDSVLSDAIEISGGDPPFSQHEAEELAAFLNEGRLPVVLSAGSPAR